MPCESPDKQFICVAEPTSKATIAMQRYAEDIEGFMSMYPSEAAS